MTQAVARDLLAGAVLQLDNDDDDLLTTIHDEIIAEPLQARADARLARDEGGDGRSPRLGLRSAPKGRGQRDGEVRQMTRKRHVDYVRDYAQNLVPVIPNDVKLSPNSKIDPGNLGKVPGQRKD